MVERPPDSFHAPSDIEIVPIGVHVPNEPGRDGDETTTGLAQAASQQQGFAERLRVVLVPATSRPAVADAAVAIFIDEVSGVIPRNRPRILPRQIKCVSHTAEHDLEGLLAILVKSLGGPALFNIPPKPVQ